MKDLVEERSHAREDGQVVLQRDGEPGIVLQSRVDHDQVV